MYFVGGKFLILLYFDYVNNSKELNKINIKNNFWYLFNYDIEISALKSLSDETKFHIRKEFITQDYYSPMAQWQKSICSTGD